ncbi:MAG: hypothetical protein H6618_08165 [Deltaproteobacteria bacterium]|nr:hypothetical protein [Deltaproteobacteria bacterium]
MNQKNCFKRHIISRTPYRISLGGGGTDLPFYARERGGFLISAAINHYTYVSATKRTLDEQILVQTTDVQFADHLENIRHQFVREALKFFEIHSGIQVGSYAMLPSSLGLASSSCFTVGLVKTLSAMKGMEMSATEVAELAYHLERERLGLAGGVQDQYICSPGGIQKISVSRDYQVESSPLNLDLSVRRNLEQHLVLIYCGIERDSEKVIRSQLDDPQNTLSVYDRLKDIGMQSVTALENGDIDQLGRLMHEHWREKKSLSASMSNSHIDQQYLHLMEAGATGGKIVGAGGGGFFLMAVPGKTSTFREKIRSSGFRALDWAFDWHGSRVIETME